MLKNKIYFVVYPLILFLIIVDGLVSRAVSQSYEAERGILEGGAIAQGCENCADKEMVGYLGGDMNGSLTLNVNVSSSGAYALTLFYCTDDSRKIHVSTNNNTYVSVHCPPTGGWATGGETALIVYLRAGSNLIKFDNSGGWAPNLDKITLTSFDTPNIKIIPFGSGNYINYDLNNGVYDVYFNNKLTIKDAFSYCYSDKYDNSMISYTKRVLSSTPVSDSFGIGTKYVIKLAGKRTNEMRQVFYTYPNKNYFITRVSLKNDEFGCYRMSPVTSDSIILPFLQGDHRALFVPFDNDMFIRYDAKPLHSADFMSSEVTGLYDNNNGKGLIIGSLEHEVWKTGIGVAGKNNSELSFLSAIAGWTDGSITHDNIRHGKVGENKEICRSPKIMVSLTKDWRDGFEQYAKANLEAEPRYISDWKGAVPFGWNSWGKMQTSITLDKAKSVVDFFADKCTSFRTSDSSLYIDLDSYWDNLTDTQLKEFVQYCKSKGFKPGIYWGPFADWGKFNRKVEGSSYDYKSCWTRQNNNPVNIDGAYCMDPTSPGTKARIRYFIDKFKSLGFEMIKLDFLSHGAIEADSFYDKSIQTGMEAFRAGMEYLDDQIDGTMLTYASISPNMATARYTNMRRIACDAFNTIDQTAYTLNSTTYGWWLRGMYDFIDADQLVFEGASMGENRARLASAIVTGTVITGDDFSTSGYWNSRALKLLQNNDLLNLARKKRNFRPVEGNSGNKAAELFETTVGNNTYLVVFNYGSKEKEYRISLSRLRLNAHSLYQVKRLFSGSSFIVDGEFSISLPSTDAAIFSFKNADHK